MQQNIAVKVFPRSKENIVETKNGVFLVRVTAAPENGEANVAAMKLLARHLGVPWTSLHIIRGATARKKTVAIY